MTKARKINALVAASIWAALALNAACECNGWSLVGDVIGWALLVGATFLVIDNKIKEMQQ